MLVFWHFTLLEESAKEYIYATYEGKARAFMCEVNVAEFLYNYARVFG